MTLIKFSSRNLVRYNANKDDSSVYVELHYSDLDKPVILRENIDTSKIFYNSFHQVGLMSWVTFHELSEVFNIPDSERKKMIGSSIKKPDIKSSEKNLFVDMDEDDEFNNMFSNF